MDVTIPSSDGAPATPAFAIVPEGAKRGVVVVHEMYGPRPEIKRAVERFASSGYAAVAPDLFDRGRFACLRDVFRAMKSGKGVPVIQGRNARAWLCAEAGIDEAHVGLIGFCFGGGYALTAGSGWAAVSTNYGAVPEKEALRGIGAVLGCYGTRDRSMKKSPDQLRERLLAIGHEAPELHMFDAGHSFLTEDATTPRTRRLMPGMHIGDYPEARKAGWETIFAFFDRHL